MPNGMWRIRMFCEIPIASASLAAAARTNTVKKRKIVRTNRSARCKRVSELIRLGPMTCFMQEKHQQQMVHLEDLVNLRFVTQLATENDFKRRDTRTVVDGQDHGTYGLSARSRPLQVSKLATCLFSSTRTRPPIRSASESSR